MTTISIKNDNAATIPACSVVVVVSVEYTTGDANTDSEVIYHVNQYDGTRGGTVLVTGSFPILPSGRGTATDDTFVNVAIDSSGANVKNGEQWGPIPNEWYIGRGGTGFIAQDAQKTGQTNTVTAPFYRISEEYVEGQLSAPLSAPSNGWTGATTSTMTIYISDPASSSTPVNFISSGLSDITVTNRDKSMSGSSGYYAIAKKVHVNNKIEWRLVGLGCSS